MNLSIGSRCVKYLMFIFNLLFVITGVILLSIGLVIHGVYHDYQHFLDNRFFSVPSLLIAVGAIIFFIAFFGCCGAARENYCMISTFTSLLVLVFILELSAGISGYVLKTRAIAVIQDKMMGTMHEYSKGGEIRDVWDKLQHDFDCCGTMNATEWTQNWSTQGIPSSCCGTLLKPIGQSSNCTLDSSDLHHEGCYDKFVHFVSDHAVQLGGVGLGVAFLQAMGIWFSVYLARSIKNSYESV